MLLLYHFKAYINSYSLGDGQTQAMKSLGRGIIVLLCASVFLSWHGVVWSLVVTTTTAPLSDLDVITRQLGYRPTNYVCVSARKIKSGEPIAIQTYPLEGGARRRQKKAQQSVTGSSACLWLGTPFPTLYWLTCPDISKCIANLERQGLVKMIEQELRDNPKMAATLMLAHEDYAARRWQSLSRAHQEQLTGSEQSSSSLSTMQRMRDMLQYSGIAGSNLTATTTDGGTPAVKCLHTHYAHYRSATSPPMIINPVGARVHEILRKEYPDLVL